MTHRAIQNLIGHAIVDKRFREQLLNGSREQVMAGFDLSEYEKKAIRSIKANRFEDFASELHEWLEAANDEPERRSTKIADILR